MPLVRIEIIKGKDSVYKRKLMDSVHDALVNAIGIEDWDKFQRLYEIDDEFFDRSEGKTDRFTMIELTMFPGRTREQKAALYREIVRLLSENLGIQPTDIFIVINEPPNENWGLAGVQR
ncbi:MAG: tautomerase family protein [Ruminococcaceae bacterium]|nr:tautomerase family protein [Oscillospiraceae bacterium]